MKNELDSLDKHKVWEIVQKPAKSKLIKTKWVYSLKQDDAGKNIKYKARLVAAGFNQIKKIDYSESYSPVVNIESFRLLIAPAAKLKLNVNFFDVKTAYLYGDLEETVYVLPPPGYEKLIGDDKVCKLKKSNYGLPQSGRNWYMKIKGVELENFGLKQLASDNCVFIKSDNQSVLILCMYADDLAIFCNNDKMYEDIVKSQAAIQWIKGTRSSNKSRHMNLRFHYIKDLIEDTDVRCSHFHHHAHKKKGFHLRCKVATRTDPKHCACASAKPEAVGVYLSTRAVDSVGSANQNSEQIESDREEEKEVNSENKEITPPVAA
ncbi:retrovirus-related Pol polyprotein from transposon TNT 1-94 [Trichonephila clavipes]|nr:retrovirus-related Pol polyprotein from transposon TNT 1-94 [Trichonephila clavipes]